MAERDLFDFPLGPREARQSDRFAFSHDGGEIIFTLPNGLHAYLLADAAGKRIDIAPTTIVSDSSLLRRDAAVMNGVSCMSCHVNGTKAIQDAVLS